MFVNLNGVQRESLSWLFNPRNTDGMEPWDDSEPVEIEIRDGRLGINSVFLLPDGSWATYVPDWAKE
jgi:hypothetical protein